MELFDEAFISALSNDPKIALYNICNKYVNLANRGELEFKHHLEAYALAESFINANEMEFNVPPLPNENRTQKINTIINFHSQIRKNLHEYIESNEEEKILQNLRGEFTMRIGKAFSYEFSEQ